MELFSAEWFAALFSIIMIDLVLAGDNAVVIGLAARNVPKNQQKKVIFWGTAGAIAIRIAATLAVAWLLMIPGLRGIGGIVLVWIAYKLLADEKEHEIKAQASFWAALWTIVVADAAMGLDNVLAIGGAAHGDPWLVIIGLLISIPIVVWGSTLVIRLIERFPVILYLGGAILAYTAAKMIVEEPLIHDLFENGVVHYSFIAIVVIGVVLAGYLRKQQKTKAQQQKLAQAVNAESAAASERNR
ncbi:TerC family protein [Paenibacillus thermoaerophilus]|uniref:TerC family protein n=1 Tax=Paenibacillus thermoaerophilus TaxID=1215385 RepID=A0ABW2V7E3_9BACL|nr:TerC family protein [Paenibacillus thermoaerophilus]TMV17861.1 TerC family protein [Paenibacillus thermoaerophilus]